MPTDIQAPDLNYAALSPLLLVFGAAIIGVLIEAFAPAPRRRQLQIGAALAGLVAALVAVVALAGTAELVAEAAVAVDGPALFLQGTLALIGIVAILMLAERSLDDTGGAVVAQAALTPGSQADTTLAESSQVQTEVFPLAMFSLGGMMPTG